MSRSRVMKQIERLDPEKDHHKIAFLSNCYEFPFDTTRALEFALYRTYSVPSISAILDSTGEFQHRAQKRYDDTDLILSEILEAGYDGERGKAAMRRMNQLHGRYAISNEDMLYVLSTFVFEPSRWIERFGWRRLTRQEKLAAYYYWREVGRRMNIKEIPPTYEEFERYNVEYERDHFRYSDTNRRVGEATRDMFLNWFLPRPLHFLGRPFVYALMDEPLLRAFGFPIPSKVMRRVVEGALKLRARVLRLFPTRRTPRLRTAIKHRTYPKGYRIEELGPKEPAYSSPYLRKRGPEAGVEVGAEQESMRVVT